MIFPRNWMRWVPVALISGALAGCATFSFDPVVRDTVTATPSTDPSPVLTGETLAGGATAYYRVDVSQTRDLLYVEAVGSDLRVRLLRASGATIGVATSTNYFASSLSTLELMEAAAPSAIVESFTCLGPCVATRLSATTYYVRVDNLVGGSRAFDLYAYTMDENDSFEPNDSSSAPASVTAGTATGAIETLGDVDWFQYDGVVERDIQFDAANDALGLVLEIANGPTVSPGGSSTIFGGESFRVRSTANRAGAPAVSLYSVTIGDEVSGPSVDGSLEAENTTTPTSQGTITIPAFGARLYEVQVPIAQDLLYVEAEGSNVRVTLKTAGGVTLAVSESAAYFAAAVGDLATAATLRPYGIDVEFNCFGPCAAVEPTSDTYLMEIRNLSGSSTTVDLFAYTFDENDTLEPNDGIGSAIQFSTGSQSGAIERIGDEDWFEYTGPTGTITFTGVSGGGPLDLVLQIDGGPSLVPGGSATLLNGDFFVVRSSSDRAGPSATSSYTIEVD